VPELVGLNVTLITQLAPGFSVLPQVVPDTVNLFPVLPVMLQEKLMSAPVPVLETVTALV
jgi:hypothetical protein